MNGAQSPGPALVGFVLAGPTVQYFWLTNQLHGWSWLLRPGVIIIGSAIVIPIALSLYRLVKHRRLNAGHSSAGGDKNSIIGGDSPGELSIETGKELVAPSTEVNKTTALLLAVLVCIAFIYALWEMRVFNETSRAMPLLAVVPGLPIVLWY